MPRSLDIEAQDHGPRNQQTIPNPGRSSSSPQAQIMYLESCVIPSCETKILHRDLGFHIEVALHFVTSLGVFRIDWLFVE